MAKNETLSKDFFSTASRMTLTQLKSFLKDVVLFTNPKDFMPIIIWGAPGIAKSAILEDVFEKTEKGLQTVILSQIGALDANGLPHIATRTEDGKEINETEFTPTKTFGRGKKHLFLDELNNAAPSTLAAVQNLLSSRRMGGDSYNDVHIIAACNPPSTNSLAMDINFPTVSRVLHIVLEYTLDDFLTYAMETGAIHPAITAFHKKTNGTYLQAKWSCNNMAFSVPEPGVNEPFPCPRSWTLASNAMMALSKTKSNGNLVEYGFLKPLVEGCVGIKCATEFATTYAYMSKIPDIKEIFSGKLDGKKTPLGSEIAVQFLTMMSVINYCIGEINKAASSNDKITARVDNEKSPAYQLLAGIHRSVVFMGDAGTVELASMTFQSIARSLRESSLSSEFLNKLLGGIDKAKGLDRESLVKYARNYAHNQQDVSTAIG